MIRLPFVSFCIALALGAPFARAADLTPTETRWLHGIWPVVTYAKQIALPLDIIVQPQDAPAQASSSQFEDASAASAIPPGCIAVLPARRWSTHPPAYRLP